MDCRSKTVGKINDVMSPKYLLTTGTWDIHCVFKHRCKIFSYPFILQAIGSLIALFEWEVYFRKC